MNVSRHIQDEKKIPYDIIKLVWIRDAGICQHPGCKKKGEEIHHTIFRSEERGHDPKKLVLLCSEHHSYPHERAQWRGYWENWKPKEYVNYI